MRVANVSIRKFRGVSAASLQNCGELNVLIGKNNSGKSTILDALDGFFSVVSSKSIVSRSGIFREIDFHKGDSDTGPIRVAVELDLDSLELSEILDSLAAEAPQMKHALDTVDETYSLMIEVTSERGMPILTYISSIQLMGRSSADGRRPHQVIIEVSRESALEIQKRRDKAARSERQSFEIIEFAQRIGPDDFQMLRRDSEERGTATARALSRRMMATNPELAFELDSIIRHADNYGEFRRQLDLMAATNRSAARKADTDPLENAIGTFSGDTQTIPAYAFVVLGQVGAMQVLHLRDRREPVGREEAQRLLALKTRRKGPEVLKSIQETVYSLLGVSIDAFESEQTPASGENRAEMDVDEILVEMNGAGIREALRLILDNELGGPQVLLVEEPEVHLHPALETSMLRYLKTASVRTQIFVTTHSTNFLDTSEMRNVYLTRRDPSVSVSLLDYEQAEAAIPDELGLRLSSLFMYDRLVFVEGVSDEAILRELASTLGVNFGQSTVGFVSMGSARNFAHYANQATIDLLTRRRVKMSFVLDRDEASEDEVNSLRSRLGSLAQVHVLQRREIENYLAVPAALAAYVEEKRSLAGLESLDLDEEAVRQQLDACAEKLQQLTVEKRVSRAMCAPVYVDRAALFAEGSEEFATKLSREIERQVSGLQQRLAQVNEKISAEREMVAGVWSARKLDIVPGDELLDCVCRQFGVRFKKRNDGPRLARHLKEGDIANELTLFLRGLVD